MKRFSEITPSVFRGSRPLDASDLNKIHDRGITIIISLEEGWADLFSKTHEEKWWEAMGCKWIRIRCSNFFPPIFQTKKVMLEIKEAQLANEKILFHCYSGVDRTGWMAAAYKYLYLNRYSDSAGYYFRTEAVEKEMHKWFYWWRPFFEWSVERLKGKV